MRSAFRTLLVSALGIGLVALFLRNADFTRVAEGVRTARLELLLLAIALTMLTYVVRTQRWQYLLEPLGPTRFSVAFRTTVIGFAASSVFPARAGEVIRPYLLARREGLSATSTFATIIVERILDLVAVLVLLATYLLAFDPGMAARDSALFAAIRLGGLVMAPVAVLSLALMFVLAGHPEWLQVWLRRADRWLPARLAGLLGRIATMLANGFGVLRRPERLVASLGWSIVLWLIICSETWAVARAFHIAMPMVGSWLMLALLVVGVAVPTPGGVGGFHEAFRLGATAFFAADNNAAIGAAILLHATSYVPVTLLGLWFAVRDGLSLHGIKHMAETPEPVEVKA
ncbi:MAG TPA: lysylphosphatidylglycerol synthase transmembrane domain-containing protein [Vicinamibacterales bacterium]|nr:lysylphosphatidylglycerol synthase transmembrane domain-containing protein [Vicinamibacterales bacterium]